ncbi:acetolactate synthase large subunit [Halanaerobium saccharolyticum]|uniref:Acetolactate synthase n=1 Tax=Halanaerobium saccharolyticum TaxID=43595 RepID=A0A4R7Z720_9FIRM|nr:biosynthetic-type acetolactate synthase large subunit [Halanaerobium saccharolyticum]RAK09343.1 acetolactate synthase large subunit [Halanaerobium saccharolyticum]TDW06202.1 acetolactate synthase large subunit [Halanaerobium saccharolyticum]TDX60996.1 acetolactate synthase large subunit [Halanaerobium saccharolyticum]
MSRNQNNEITGAKIFVKSLEAEGVDTVFGYIGAKVIDIYDELYDSKIRHIMPHHEQGGVHAADGYARSSGKTGVCIATSGPGAANMVTALATASMDSVPLVAFTGQVPNTMIGTDGFQEADIKGITMPITKNNYIVNDIEDLSRIIKEAFHIASTGRPGPVLVDIPSNILKDKAEFYYPEQVDLPGYSPTYQANKLQLKRAAELINQANKPVIYAGGGTIISGADQEIYELAQKAEIPVTTTLNGIGIFDENNYLSLGMLGMHGTTEANLAITNSDLIIALGARFDDRVTGKIEEFAVEAEVIHIDIDPAEIGKIVETKVPITADVKLALKELLPKIKEVKRPAWIKKIKEWKNIDQSADPEKADKLLPSEIIENLYELTAGKAIITAGVGQHQMWAAQYYKYSKPRTFISSGGLGTMGYGFPAAIGAKLANPDRDVFALVGDGSFQMNIQELATAAKNHISVKIILFNNQYLGMVRQWQELFYDKRYSATCLRRQSDCPPHCSAPNDDCPEMIPDFIQVAKGYGIKGETVTERSEIKTALKNAIQAEGSYLLNFMIEEEENVFPMVSAGGSLEEMILRKDNKK